MIILKNGLVVDGFGKEKKMDVLIDEEKVVNVASSITPNKARVLDCEGKIVFPGLIDFHLHFREPGSKKVESITQGIERAILAGFTGCLMMPNTDPPVDTPEMVRFVKEKASSYQDFDFQVAAAVTRERRGEKIVEMGLLKEAGVRVLTDDGSYVQSSRVMEMAFRYASAFDLILMQHPEEQTLSAGGQINEGVISANLGLAGLPRAAEEIAILRDITLIQYYPARVHFTHLSTAGAVQLVREAKKKGLKVSADVTPHHLLLTDEKLNNFDSYFKIKPPLRTLEDAQSLEAGLIDKTIDVIATDHAPHPPEEKEVEFEKAAFGVVGLDTALSLIYRNFVLKGNFSLTDLARLMSLNPATLLGLKRGIKPGLPAFLTIFDPEKEWVYKKENNDWAYNSPFLGWKLKGKAFGVITNGRLACWEERLLG